MYTFLFPKHHLMRKKAPKARYFVIIIKSNRLPITLSFLCNRYFEACAHGWIFIAIYLYNGSFILLLYCRNPEITVVQFNTIFLYIVFGADDIELNANEQRCHRYLFSFLQGNSINPINTFVKCIIF